MTRVLLACLIVVTSGLFSIAADASSLGNNAYYNRNAIVEQNLASIDLRLSGRSVADGQRNFVPSYPVPQQPYVRVPLQRSQNYAPQPYYQPTPGRIGSRISRYGW